MNGPHSFTKDRTRKLISRNPCMKPMTIFCFKTTPKARKMAKVRERERERESARHGRKEERLARRRNRKTQEGEIYCYIIFLLVLSENLTIFLSVSLGAPIDGRLGIAVSRLSAGNAGIHWAFSIRRRKMRTSATPTTSDYCDYEHRDSPGHWNLELSA